MSLRSGGRAAARSHPIAAELAVVVAVLVVLASWQHVARQYVVPAVGFGPGVAGLDAVGSLLVAGAVTGGVLLVGVAAVVGAYAVARDVETGLALPAADRLPTVAAAALVPVALVAATKLVGVLTGTAYSTVLMRSYGSAAAFEHFASMAALVVLVGVPTLVLVCQVLVQGSFRRVLGGDAAAVLATLVGGLLLVEADGGTLNTLPQPGALAGAVLFVAALSVALYGLDRAERSWLRALSVVPVGLFVAGTVLAGVVAIDSMASGLFVVTQFGVLGVAAWSYERTGSLLVPALAYASFLATSEAVVFFLEAGVQHW